MTRLSRRQLLEIAHTLVLANTPLSLLKGLRRSSAMNTLRQWSPKELCEYYDRITARARRSEIAVALAYICLVAIFLKARDCRHVPVDASRLNWGESIRDHLTSSNSSTQSFTPAEPTPRVNVETRSSPGGATLYGPDNQPIVWRNEI